MPFSYTRHGVMIYKGTAFDDIQRQALMIYSHKRLMIYTASRDYGVKRKSITLSHHHALQGISSAIAHIERFSVYRKSQQGFISTRVSTRNKVPSFRPNAVRGEIP